VTENTEPSGEAREVPLAELTRHPSSVIESVRGGDVAVVTRHHRPVAPLEP